MAQTNRTPPVAGGVQREHDGSLPSLTLDAHRAQRLAALHWLDIDRAALIAPLALGGSHAS